MQGKRAVLKRADDIVDVQEIPEQRECTRCDGVQHLLSNSMGFGKYRCDICELIIGFDTLSSPGEFIIYRGHPSRYTKDIYGSKLLQKEQRI